MNKAVIVLGSSRLHGNTWKLCNQVREIGDVEIINLKEFDIHEYDYENKFDYDDFPQLLEKIVKYDIIILATPIYWYSMSARLKMFVDRLSDLVTIKKDLGREIKGKKMALISTNYDGKLEFDFALTFRLIAKYLQMEFLDHLHFSGLEFKDEKLSSEGMDKIQMFVEKLSLQKDIEQQDETT